MRFTQQTDGKSSPAEQLLANIDFRIESAKDMVRNLIAGRGQDVDQSPATPLERRSEIIKRRRAILNGTIAKRAVDREEQEEFPELPDNVVIATDDVREPQIEVAQEKASDFNKIVLKDGGRVDGLGHGRGGSVTLREFQDQEFTIDRDITAEEPEPEQDQSFNQVRSMSEASIEKHGQ